MKSLKWEGIGTKNLFPHTSSFNAIMLQQFELNATELSVVEYVICG